ncbi:MAG: leucine-rich repeat protein [Treponema sp.]|nr:leucine-rich repeat protein [Treponema sp.]
MKKLIAILSALVLLGVAAFARPAKAKGAKASADGAAPADNSKVSIAVPAPKAVNLEGGADWIPLFIQGIITTNFQQYSGLAVIDRQNADMVKAEQRLSESAEFDEKNTLELGKMTSAKLIITGSIMAKSGSYALTFSITDAESGETKATASVPDCPRSALEDGTAANQISYDLMAGYGIALGDDAKTRLTQTASVMAAETSAQVSVAKGIIAEQSGSNIEALTYYIQARKNDNRLSEATSRMAGMTTVVAGGNFGANAKNLMKLHDDWDKLLLEAAGLIAANPPEFAVRYFTDIEPLALTEKDYANKTMSFRMGAPYLMQTSGEENFKIAEELMDAMHEIPESDNWGKKMNGFPWTYADDIPGDHWLKWVNAKETKEYPLTVVLLDANKNLIASKPYTLYVGYNKYDAYGKSNAYGDWVWQRACEYFTISSDNKTRGGDILLSLTISDVPVGNADTDKIYISVENAGSQKLSVLPTDALPADKAISVLEAGSHNGTVKVGGFLIGDDYFGSPFRSSRPFALDLSECVNVLVIRGFSRHNGELRSITLPKGAREIRSYAFSYCVSLRSIIIPESVIVIESGMCKGSMPSIYYAGSKEQWKKIEKNYQNVYKHEFPFSPTKYNYNPQETDGKKKNKKKK